MFALLLLGTTTSLAGDGGPTDRVLGDFPTIPAPTPSSIRALSAASFHAHPWCGELSCRFEFSWDIWVSVREVADIVVPDAGSEPESRAAVEQLPP